MWGKNVAFSTNLSLVLLELYVSNEGLVAKELPEILNSGVPV